MIASAWMAVHYAIYLFSGDLRKRFKVLSFSFDKEMLWRQLRLALPMGTQEFIIAFGWTFFMKVVGIIGVVELATTHIIFTIMHASFMPAMGVGMACSTLVSKYMGEEKYKNLFQVLKSPFGLLSTGWGPLELVLFCFQHFTYHFYK